MSTPEPQPDLAPLRGRKEELERQLADPRVFADGRKAAALAQELRHLGSAVAAGERFESAQRALKEAEEMRDDPGAEGGLQDMAALEARDLAAELPALREAFLRALVPPDPNEARNVILEIRAGTGGDEAALFASELTRLYTRFAERRGWSSETLSLTPSDLGGVREAVLLIEGPGAFAALRHEAGVHRVQRVPATEGSGRIHTSAATVAVLPEAEETEVDLRPEDLDMSVARASGAGGQHVNKTESAVQIIHRPTGIMVYCADERSQLRNRQKALRVLRARLLERQTAVDQAARADARRGQVGTGDRSERIRTYNFHQNRVTDHRVDLTLHGLQQVLDGDISDLVQALSEADLRARAAALTQPKG
jgi:peptide chain release factor 1